MSIYLDRYIRGIKKQKTVEESKNESNHLKKTPINGKNDQNHGTKRPKTAPEYHFNTGSNGLLQVNKRPSDKSKEDQHGDRIGAVYKDSKGNYYAMHDGHKNKKVYASSAEEAGKHLRALHKLYLDKA